VNQQGTKPAGETSNGAFDQWEVEKKYKKNLDALKQEIEERNREIQMARKEVKDSNERAHKIENEKRLLEARLVDKSSKPPR
jgi:predicted  nucleic acid-binding Zn-ribbon protein